MPRRKAQRAEVTKVWRPNRKSEIGRKVELYSAAYKLAWQQIPPLLRSERPDYLCVFTLLFGANLRGERRTPRQSLSRRLKMSMKKVT